MNDLDSMWSSLVLAIDANRPIPADDRARPIEAEPDLQLDRIVTVVDASNADSDLGPGLGLGGPIVSRQLDAANVVVATHLDRITVEQRTSVIDRLAAHVLGRPVLPSTADEPEVAALLPGGITGAHPGPAHTGAAYAAPATSAVDGHITAITVDNPRSIVVDELAALVGADFTTRSRRPPGLGGKPEVLRLKGTLLVDGTASFVQLTPSTAVVEPIANATAEHGTSAGGGQLGVTIVAATRADAEALAAQLA